MIIVSLVIFSIGYSLQEIIVQETENVSLHPDIFDPDGDELTYTFSYPLDSQGKWQTNYGDAGTYNVTMTVSDGVAIATENISLIVKKKEEVPIFEKIQPNLDTMDIKENDVMGFNIEVHDLNNDQLQYTWLLNDEHISNQNSITFQPGYESSGNYKLVVKVSDGINEISKKWEINVLDVDRKPIFLPIVPITINENQEIEIILNASDPDGDKISYSAENLPKSVILSENIFFWKPNYDTVKKESLLDIMRDNYHILDRLFIIEFIAKSKELSTTQSAIIRVNDVNRAPIIEESEPIIVNEGDLIKIIPVLYEPDGDKVSISYSGWMSSDTYKTTFDDAGKHNVIISASDGWNVVSKEINITVCVARCGQSNETCCP
ncbi:MAG: hypothetical protein AABY14_02485 [Nanoarchaeota archaeon]